MKPPLYVRPITDEERQALKAGLRSPVAFRVRRCQIVLASTAGEQAAAIAQHLQCASQTVRNAIRDFEQRGLASLVRGSTVPHSVQPVLTEAKRERLRAMLHQSPRLFGKPQSLWALKLLAEVCQEQGLSETVLSEPTLRDAVLRLDVNWKRAKQWITSPDPA